MAVIIEKELVQLNDGMKYVKLKPHPQLGEYIDFYWTLEYTLDSILDLTILPENSSEIIFNLSREPIYFQKNGAFQKAPIMEIIGPLGQAMAVQAVQPFQLLAVRFFPHTASVFFSEPMDVFSDRISELSTTRKYQWNSVWNQLLELQTLSKRIECLNLLFLSILSIKKEHQPKFHELFNWLYGLQDPVDGATIVLKSGYS